MLPSFLLASGLRSRNPDCLTPIESEKCEITCEEANLQCLVDCQVNTDSDPACISLCSRQFRVHLDKCPCYTDCYDGCPCDEYESEYCSLSCQELNQDQFISCSDLAQESLFKCLAKCEPFDTDCEHKCSIDFDERLATCPCMDNCPDGCPCPYYQCEPDDTTLVSSTTSMTTTTTTVHIGTKPTERTTTTTASTTTATGPTTKDPSVYNEVSMITFNPNISSQSIFTLSISEASILVDSEDVELDNVHSDRHSMCSFLFNNQMFLLGGGETNRNRFLRLDLQSGSLDTLPVLPFEHTNGLCAGYERYGIACGGSEDQSKRCYKLDKNLDWSILPNMKNAHTNGGLANIGEQPVAIMGQGTDTVESFDDTEGEWTVRSQNTQFEYDYVDFTVVSIGPETFCFGGRLVETSYSSSEVYRVFNYKLYRFGQSMLSPRRNHVTLVSNETTIVHIGGDECQPWEIWEQIEVGVFNIRKTETCLPSWSQYPNSFLLD